MRKSMQRRLVILACCICTVYFFSFFLQRQFETFDSNNDSSIRSHMLQKREDSTWTKPSATGSSILSTTATPPGSCNFITLSQKYSDEGLGSLLFQYASLYGIATSNKKLSFLHSSYPLYSKFQLSIPEENNSVKNFQNISEPSGCCVYQNPKLHCNDNVTLLGHRRSWRYFHRQRSKLRNEFRLLPELREMCLRNLSAIFRDFEIDSSKCLLIGVHARVGPFQPIPASDTRSYEFDSADYLRRAMHHFKSEYRDDYGCIAYLVIGNDYDWIYKTFVDDRDLLDFRDASTIIAFSGPGDPAVDLCMLTHTNHTIFTFGTFGWWVAYLTGGLVAYQNEYADVIAEIKEYSRKDYYLPEWTAL